MNEIKVYAKSKYIKVSPQKIRLVIDMVRGENAQYASELLQFVNKAAALPVRKTIDTAIANAINNFDLNKKELKIVEARVDEAPTFKRGRAVSKGRYHQILKRNSHVIIAVSDGTKVEDIKKKGESNQNKSYRERACKRYNNRKNKICEDGSVKKFEKDGKIQPG